MDKYIQIKEEVKEAIKLGNVVSLESTIISHGMPYPKNLTTALECEKIVRDNGCVPATIAIIDGIIKIGLTHEELEYLAKAKDVVKVSKRDIPIALSKKLTGATTVSATLIFSELAKIKVFATGGIGGVHRGAENNFDISNDLTQLSLSNVSVVCAGVKSILHIEHTLEYLETLGISVIGYKTNEFPSFFNEKSGFKTDASLNENEIAKAMDIKWSLGINGGFVIANPIPSEHSIEVNEIIEKALVDASKEGIKGKDITPYLLDKVNRISEGKSLEANIKLVYNNALVASLIAKRYSEIKMGI